MFLGIGVNIKKGFKMVEFAQVKEVLKSQLGIDYADIKLESNIMNDLGADSLDVVELIMEFEDEFNLEISDEDAEKLKTAEDILKYLNKKK